MKSKQLSALAVIVTALFISASIHLSDESPTLQLWVILISGLTIIGAILSLVVSKKEDKVESD